MKHLRVRAAALLLCLSPLAIHAQTWVGGAAGNTNNFNNAGNWTGGVPVSNASTNITFGTTSFPSTNFSGAFTVNSLTFTGASTYSIGGTGEALSVGAGGINTNSGSGGANLNSGLPITLTANQTWTTVTTLTVNGNVTDGAGSFSLTKAGTGTLVLSGINSYDGGTTVNGGALYLGQTNSSSGTITVGASGALGAAYYDLSLSNNLTLASGATLGGSSQGGDSSLELGGTVTLDSGTATLNLGANSDVFFAGTVGAASSTALTVQGNGTSIAILGDSLSNVASVTADNAAVAFGASATLPTTQIHATNGGYVSVADVGGSTPSVSTFMGLITNKAGFNGVLGFDTEEDADSPHVYSDNINLAGFTNGNVRLGSLTSATLTGTITPVGQSYDFGGFAAQDGLLVVKSDLVERNLATTSVSVVSPTASGGAPQNGMVLILQGANNDFSGNIDVSYSSLVLDSPISGTTNINLGAYSYAGFTETANSGLDFATLVARVLAGGYDNAGTSILGIDSRDVISNYVDNDPGTSSTHTITDAVDLSDFSSIYLGTLTGATISGTISAPSDGTLRLVGISGDNPFTIQSQLTAANVTNGLVIGMDGSEGAVVLATDNLFAGNTTLLGGQLLVGDTTTSALSSGTLTVTAPTAGDQSVLGTALGSASLANNITVTGTTLRVGTGDDEDGDYLAGTTNLTLSGVISGTGGLEITGETTLGGANTYSGGTLIRADTTVESDSGLGTGFVFVGYSDPDTTTRSTLTFTTSAPTIGSLSDASQFVYQGGTGNINLTGASPTLTIDQSIMGTYSGQFTGNAVALVKTGGQQLALTGANAGQIASTTINAGSIAIGNSQATTATYGGNITVNVTGGGTGLFFRPGGSQTMTYGGSISGAGAVTVNGSGGATTQINGGSSSFTGATTVASGKLQIAGDNYWSASSATTVQGGATLQLDGNQTIRNLSGNGTVNLSTGGKTLTVDSAGTTTFSGALSGSGGLTKTGASSFTISGTNTYTGNTTVSGGTLLVNSSLFSSPTITVDNAAILMGTGALNDLMLNGTYRPGLDNSAALTTQDNLTMGNTGLLHMELGGSARGTNYDALNIANAFSVDGTLSVTFINSFNPTLGATFNLFDFTSLTGTFDTLNLQGLGGGLAWDTSALYTTGVLSVVAIPEPATTAIFAGLAVLGLAAWRRRSARARAAVQVVTRL